MPASEGPLQTRDGARREESLILRDKAPNLADMNLARQELLYPILEGTSRSFYLGIQALEQPEKDTVCLGYLFCRLLDLLEDASDVDVDCRISILDAIHSWCGDIEDKSRLSEILALQVEHTGEFEEYFLKVPRERELYESTPAVLSEIAALPESFYKIFSDSLLPMFEGMRVEILASSTPKYRSLQDFDDYCFAVAGTVGHFLTRVFLHAEALSEDVPRESLLQQGEAFGRALQIVNIVKDFHGDWEERRCFWPELDGYSFEDTKPHIEVLLPILKKLDAKFQQDYMQAKQYIDLIDIQRPDIRFFCEFPLEMAKKNMELAMRDTSWLALGTSPKLPRDETMALLESLSPVVD